MDLLILLPQHPYPHLWFHLLSPGRLTSLLQLYHHQDHVQAHQFCEIDMAILHYIKIGEDQIYCPLVNNSAQNKCKVELMTFIHEEYQEWKCGILWDLFQQFNYLSMIRWCQYSHFVSVNGIVLEEMLHFLSHLYGS